MKNCNSRIISGTCSAVFLLIIISNTNFVFSHTKKPDSNRPVRNTNRVNNATSNSTNIENLKKKVEQFLSIDDSNPMALNSHIYFNIATEILSYDELLDLAEEVIKKGIEVNTIKNLRKTHPDMSESGMKQQQKLEFGRLYCQYAWLLKKKNQPGNAYSAIIKAMNYISSPTPNDYIRLGIIEYESGKKQQGWDNITKALIADTIVERQNPEYRKAVYKIIKDKYAAEKEPAAFIDEFRSKNEQTLPNLSLLALNNIKLETHRHDGQVIFINFFSPTCGSCQQEIPGIKGLYEKFSPGNEVVFIFILNRPDLKKESIALFEKSNIKKPVIAVLQDGSVWDLISEEPSIWVTDKTGKVVFRHSGYKQGDEAFYQKILSKLIKD